MGQVPGTLQYVMPFAHVTAFSEKGERGEGKEIEEVILLKIKPCMPPPPRPLTERQPCNLPACD